MAAAGMKESEIAEVRWHTVEKKPRRQKKESVKSDISTRDISNSSSAAFARYLFITTKR